MIASLNGWQRLWLVLAGIYLIPVVAFTILAFPDSSEYSRARLRGSIGLVGKYLESETPGYVFEGSDTVREKYYGDLSDDQIIERVHTKFKDKVDFSKLEDEYQRRITALPSERQKVLGFGALWWLAPVLSVYALGAAIAWILRGFRGVRPNDSLQRTRER